MRAKMKIGLSDRANHRNIIWSMDKAFSFIYGEEHLNSIKKKEYVRKNHDFQVIYQTFDLGIKMTFNNREKSLSVKASYPKNFPSYLIRFFKKYLEENKVSTTESNICIINY